MTIDKAIKTYTSNAEYERTHGNLQGCLDFRQLAEWLKDYKRLLEQQPSEDCISRQYLLDNCVVDKVTMPYVPVNRIENAPSVTPQQKKGRWIDDGFYAEGWSHKAFHCSECGHNILGFKDDLKIECPNCRCKMQEVEE